MRLSWEDLLQQTITLPSKSYHAGVPSASDVCTDAEKVNGDRETVGLVAIPGLPFMGVFMSWSLGKFLSMVVKNVASMMAKKPARHE